MTRENFLKLLAEFIQNEVDCDSNSPEPFREAGDKLIDEALAYID